MPDSKIDVVILVSSAYAINYYPDDLLLKNAIEENGFSVKIIVWDDDSFDFLQTRLVIIRSCWDFDQRINEFFVKITQIAQSCLLVNNLETMLAYRSKYYLQHLEAQGIPIVPTQLVKTVEDAFVAIHKLSSNYIVIKPHISASGRDTYQIKTSDKAAIKTAVESILACDKDVVLQAYLESVEKIGERSTVVIDGAIIHTIQKPPEAGNFLVHEHHGGTYKDVVISDQEKSFVERIIRTFKKVPMYMRIDYLFDADCKPLLLEAELVEPNLYLSRSDKVLRALTTKIISSLNK